MALATPSRLCNLPGGLLSSGAILNEGSGIVPSRLHENLVWIIEDSDPTVQNRYIYGINTVDGSVRTIIEVTGIVNVTGGPALFGQWEDMTYHDATNTMMVFNCGNNGHTADTFWGYKINEPTTLGPIGGVIQVPVLDQYRFRWMEAGVVVAGGYNCEAAFVTADGRLGFVNKEPANITGVFRPPLALSTTGVNDLTKVASLPQQASITGCDMNPQSTVLVTCGGNYALHQYAHPGYGYIGARNIPKARRPNRVISVTTTAGSATITSAGLFVSAQDLDSPITGLFVREPSYENDASRPYPDTATKITAVASTSSATMSRTATLSGTRDATIWTDQDEAIAFTADGESLLRTTEGAESEIIFIPYVDAGVPVANPVNPSLNQGTAQPSGSRKAKVLGLTGAVGPVIRQPKFYTMNRPINAQAAQIIAAVKEASDEKATHRAEAYTPCSPADAQYLADPTRLTRTTTPPGFTLVTTPAALQSGLAAGQKVFVNNVIPMTSALRFFSGAFLWIGPNGWVQMNYNITGPTTSNAFVQIPNYRAGNYLGCTVTPAHDVGIVGPGKFGPRISGQGGNIISLAGDDIALRDFKTDVWSSGKYLTSIGNNWHCSGFDWRVTPGSGSGTGGFRWMGGTGLRVIDAFCISGDDVWQVVQAGGMNGDPLPDGSSPPTTQPSDPFWDVQANDSVFQSCGGQSYSARFLICGLQDRWDDQKLTRTHMVNGTNGLKFIDMVGKNGGAAIAAQNKSSTGAIENLKYVDCLVDGIDGEGTGQAGAIFYNALTGPIRDIHHYNTRVINHHRPGFVAYNNGTRLDRIGIHGGLLERAWSAGNQNDPIIHVDAGCFNFEFDDGLVLNRHNPTVGYFGDIRDQGTGTVTNYTTTNVRPPL